MIDRRANLVEGQAVAVEGVRVHLDADGGQRCAANAHLADAGDLGEFLSQYGRGRIIELARPQVWRGEGQDHDGRLGGIDLPIGRLGRHAGRERSARGVDRRLHVASRVIDVAVQLEDHLYLDRTLTAGRAKLGHAGD